MILCGCGAVIVVVVVVFSSSSSSSSSSIKSTTSTTTIRATGWHNPHPGTRIHCIHQPISRQALQDNKRSRNANFQIQQGHIFFFGSSLVVFVCARCYFTTGLFSKYSVWAKQGRKERKNQSINQLRLNKLLKQQLRD